MPKLVRKGDIGFDLQELFSKALDFFWLQTPADKTLETEKTENVCYRHILRHQFFNTGRLRAGIKPCDKICKSQQSWKFVGTYSAELQALD
jgi:hypothetical protein